MCTEQWTLNESSFYSEHEWKLPVFHGIPIKKLCNKHKNWAYMPKKPNEKQYSRSFLKKHRLFLQTLDFFCFSMKNIFNMSLNKIFIILNISNMFFHEKHILYVFQQDFYHFKHIFYVFEQYFYHFKQILGKTWRWRWIIIRILRNVSPRTGLQVPCSQLKMGVGRLVLPKHKSIKAWKHE